MLVHGDQKVAVDKRIVPSRLAHGCNRVVMVIRIDLRERQENGPIDDRCQRQVGR